MSDTCLSVAFEAEASLLLIILDAGNMQSLWKINDIDNTSRYILDMYFPHLEHSQAQDYTHNPFELLKQTYQAYQLQAARLNVPISLVLEALRGNQALIKEQTDENIKKYLYGYFFSNNTICMPKGFNAEYKNSIMELSLLIAAQAGNLSVIKHLLNNYYFSIENRFQAFYLAAEYQRLPVLTYILTHTLHNRKFTPQKGAALIYAARHGARETVKTLIQLCENEIIPAHREEALKAATHNDDDDIMNILNEWELRLASQHTLSLSPLFTPSYNKTLDATHNSTSDISSQFQESCKISIK